MRKVVPIGLAVVVVLALAGWAGTQVAAPEGEPAQMETDDPDLAAGADTGSQPGPDDGAATDAGQQQSAESHHDEGQAGGNAQHDQGQAGSASHHGGHGGPVDVPANAQTRRVEGTEFAFAPAEFTVTAGKPVAVTLTNAGEVEHEWVLIGADGSQIAHAHAQPGKNATAVFTLSQPGTYEVRCTIPGHAEQGMIGRVTAT